MKKDLRPTAPVLTPAELCHSVASIREASDGLENAKRGARRSVVSTCVAGAGMAALWIGAHVGQHFGVDPAIVQALNLSGYVAAGAGLFNIGRGFYHLIKAANSKRVVGQGVKVVLCQLQDARRSGANVGMLEQAYMENVILAQ